MAVFPTVPDQANETAGQVLLAGDDDAGLALERGQSIGVSDGGRVGVVERQHLLVHARHEETREHHVLGHHERDFITGSVAFDALPAERTVPLPADQELRLRIVERLAEAFAAIRLAVTVQLVLAGRVDGVVELDVRLAALGRIVLRDGVVILVRPRLDHADVVAAQHHAHLVLVDLDVVALRADAAAGIPAHGRLELHRRVLTRPAALRAKVLGEGVQIVAVGAGAAITPAAGVVVVDHAVAVVVDAVEAFPLPLVVHGRRTGGGRHDRVGLGARIRRFGRLGVDLLRGIVLFDLDVGLAARVDLLVAVVVVVGDVDDEVRRLGLAPVRQLDVDVELVVGGVRAVVAGRGQETEKGDENGDRAHGFPPRSSALWFGPTSERWAG